MYTFEGDHGTDIQEYEIPEELKDKASKYRETMLDKLSMFSDELANKYLEGEEISVDLIKKVLRE